MLGAARRPAFRGRRRVVRRPVAQHVDRVDDDKVERRQRVAHAAENVLVLLRDGALGVSPAVMGDVLAAVDVIRDILAGLETTEEEPAGDDSALVAQLAAMHSKIPDRFGEFGGQYVPESLMDCLTELEDGFNKLKDDPAFWDEYRSYYPYMGRPGQLHVAERLTEHAGGAKIWLKREDLNHTGSHKINNALGQILLAKKLGKTKIIAETGAGQHGVATATVCAKFGMACTVYMGAVSHPGS